MHIVMARLFSFFFVLLLNSLHCSAYEDAIVIEAEDESLGIGRAEDSGECTTLTGQHGNCTTFKECYPLVAETRSEDLIDDFYRFVKSPNCSGGSGNETSDVCCNRSSKYVTEKSQHSIFNTQQCGQQLVPDPKIVGGKQAYIGEYPWMVAVFGKNGKLTCGATLIDNNYVLCAAHCIEHYGKSDVGKLRLHLGDYNIHSGADLKHVTRKVSKIIKHKYFDINTFVNDITLFKMSEPVEFTDYIQPICLATANTNGQLSSAIVAGWGRIGERLAASSTLLKVNVPFVTNEECNRVYNGIAPKGILSNMVCAGAIGVDSCIGDSGGPLMINRDYGAGKRVYTQVGIVSFGKGCAELPGVYTRVDSFATWINNNRKY